MEKNRKRPISLKFDLRPLITGSNSGLALKTHHQLRIPVESNPLFPAKFHDPKLRNVQGVVSPPILALPCYEKGLAWTGVKRSGA